jgi:hypothetical protein
LGQKARAARAALARPVPEQPGDPIARCTLDWLTKRYGVAANPPPAKAVSCRSDGVSAWMASVSRIRRNRRRSSGRALRAEGKSLRAIAAVLSIDGVRVSHGGIKQALAAHTRPGAA